MAFVGPRRSMFFRPDTLREQLTKVLSDGATVANYQPGNYTGTLNASAWLNTSPFTAGSLDQGSAAAQPIILPYTGTKYVYLPAVASNTVTTPTKTITGNFTITFDVALNDYTPAADVTLFGKTSGNDGFQVKWLTTDKVRLVIGNGTGLTNVDVVAASSFTDGTEHTVTIVWQDGVGATFKYDGVTSGSQVAAAKTLTNAAVDWTLGSTTSIGKVYDHTMTNSAATTYYHLNPGASAETTTNAATWVSDNGETYTLNSAGATPAQVVGSPQLLLDGTAHFMATAALTLNQPATRYIVFKQISWTLNDVILTGLYGGPNDSSPLYQSPTTPKLSIYAGTQLSESTGNLAVGSYGIVTQVFDGASSLLQINNTTAVTGAAGAQNMGGITLGAHESSGTQYGNFQVKEIIARSGADSAATRAQVKSLLNSLHGVY